MSLRRRGYLVESKQFKKGVIDFPVFGERKKLAAYIMGHVAVTKLHGRRWMVVHVPLERVASAGSVKNPTGDFTKLGPAKKFAGAVYQAFGKDGVKDYDVLHKVKKYGDYLAGGGDSEFSEWLKDN